MPDGCEWCKGWKSRRSALKMGLNTKVRVAVDARGFSLKVLVSDGNVHDSQKAEKLIQDFRADYLVEDKGHDSKSIVEFAKNNGMNVVIPSCSNATNSRKYNKELYKRRHLVEIFPLKSRSSEVFRRDTSKILHLSGRGGNYR